MPIHLTKIGVFYDGGYFSNVSSYYLYHHAQKARISLSGLHRFIRHRVAQEEHADPRYCQVVDAHYFRGRFSAQQVSERDMLFKERVWDDVLMKEGIVTHYLPVGQGGEKGVDVWLALECLEATILKSFDCVVLVAGDSDYLPLVRKLNARGVRVMVLGWSISFMADGEEKSTRVAHGLMNEATYAVQMDAVIDAFAGLSAERRADVADFFVRRRDTAPSDPSDGRDESSGWRSGTVVNLLDGFGFLRPDDAEENLFFHASALDQLEFGALTRGTAVAFIEGIGQKGVPAALRVRAR